MIKINGKKFINYESLSISKSIETIADSFNIKLKLSSLEYIQAGDLIEIYNDDKLYLTGYVDYLNISVNETINPATIAGRSKTADLVDCNIRENKQYNKLTPRQIITDLAKPFGISCESVELDAIDKFDTKVTETYFECINRLCKQNNVMPISKNDGNLKLWKNEAQKVKELLKIESIEYNMNFVDRFSEYIYKKESAKNNIKDYVLKDDTVKRFRPFVETNTEDRSNEDLTKWKLNNAKANSINLSAKVFGWDYEVGELVKVRYNLIDNVFLIKEANYSKGDGTTTDLILVDKELYKELKNEK